MREKMNWVSWQKLEMSDREVVAHFLLLILDKSI